VLEIATERLVLRPLEIEGKVRTAKGVEQMNAAPASVIAGMWLGVEAARFGPSSSCGRWQATSARTPSRRS
jgi:hypothetical protein